MQHVYFIYLFTHLCHCCL